MKREILVSVEPVADGSQVGRLRNLGEDLFRLFRSEEQAFVDIDAVDRAMEWFVIVVDDKSQFRRVLRKVEVQVERHFPDGIAAVSVVDGK